MYRLTLVAVLVALALFGSYLPATAANLTNATETARIYTQSGVAAFKDGDYATAYDAFSKAIQLNPEYGTAYSNRCLTDIHLRKNELAILDCSQALELRPTDREAYLNRGLAAYRIGNYEAAIADDTRVLELTPHDPRAYYNRGLAKVGQGAYREALVDYGEALRQLSPLERTTVALIQNDRGVAHLMLQQHESAIDAFTQAIQANAGDIRAFFNRGCAYHQQGNLTAALDDFTQVITLDPQYAQAYLNQGLLHHQLGDQGKAIASLQSAATLFQQQQQFPDYLKARKLIEQLKTSLTALADSSDFEFFVDSTVLNS
jgi:tetratricopeptide (TPR) repeat protein